MPNTRKWVLSGTPKHCPMIRIEYWIVPRIQYFFRLLPTRTPFVSLFLTFDTWKIHENMAEKCESQNENFVFMICVRKISVFLSKFSAIFSWIFQVFEVGYLQLLMGISFVLKLTELLKTHCPMVFPLNGR